VNQPPPRECESCPRIRLAPVVWLTPGYRVARSSRGASRPMEPKAEGRAREFRRATESCRSLSLNVMGRSSPPDGSQPAVSLSAKVSVIPSLRR
jgi:hypothetical protein